MYFNMLYKLLLNLDKFYNCIYIYYILQLHYYNNQRCNYIDLLKYYEKLLQKVDM